MIDKQTQPLTILYFARLGEQLGRRQESLELPEGTATVGQLRDLLAQRSESWSALQDGSIRMAVNQEIGTADTPLQPGDEVAFFPPVTGG